MRASRRLLGVGLLAAADALHAGEFSVSPIRADLRPTALSETITVTNHAKERLRVAIRLMAWSQDEQGKDVYTDSADLVYFPRQMDIDPESRKVVRVGLKSATGPVERTYRLFIEEIKDGFATSDQPVVNFNFRFGVPIFVAPQSPKDAFEVLEPDLRQGKVRLAVRNDGNQHVRLTRITVSDGKDFHQDIAGWYSLSGTQRQYTADIPAGICRNAKVLTLSVEGPELKVDRQLHVDPANCA
ncbi:fimbrial biogenesis chaperone [Ramlibacter sp. MMS24-I3-19]|uniref:fimbrial biogenesis chaperone n=1 Tax=Ramlibacter sp. MMS24-I3-19 TaxID=3416606 RepID=UPI003CFEA9C5